MNEDLNDIEAKLRQLAPAPAPPLRMPETSPMGGRGDGRMGRGGEKKAWLRAAAVFLVAVGLGWWTAPERPAARVLSARGAPFAAGQTLRADETFAVPAGGSVSLALADGSRLDLGGRTETSAALGPGRAGGAVLSIERGHLACVVADAKGPAGEFRIATPLGVVIDKGTVFTIDVTEEEEAMTKGEKIGAAVVVTVGVVSGCVQFRGHGPDGAGKALDVHAGERLTIATGKPPVLADAREREAATRAAPHPPSEIDRRLDEIDLMLASDVQLSEPVATSEEQKRKEKCLRRLKCIGTGTVITHDRGALRLDRINRSFRCPCGGAEVPYTYGPPPVGELSVLDPSSWIVAYEPEPSRTGKRSLLFLDGHVGTLAEEDFQNRLAHQQEMTR